MKAEAPTSGEKRGSRAGPILAGSLIFFGLWVLLSGKWDAFHLGTGAILAFAVAWIHFRLPSLESGNQPLLNLIRLPGYLLWLLWQMLLSAYTVAKVILFPKKCPPDPRLIAFDSPQPSLVHGVLFANSITLTPGTLTLDYQDDRYLVHALTEATAGDLLTGTMAEKVARLGGPVEKPIIQELSYSEEEDES